MTTQQCKKRPFQWLSTVGAALAFAACAGNLPATETQGPAIKVESTTKEGAKTIRIRPNEMAPRPREDRLDVTLDPIKDSFRVGESIRFKVRGNQSFYLYLFNRDEDNGRWVQILPNRRDENNYYRAGQNYTVPNQDIQFYSDGRGVERVVMIASTRHLNFDARDPLGDFMVRKGDELVDETKSIRIRSNDRDSYKRRETDTVMDRIEVDIR